MRPVNLNLAVCEYVERPLAFTLLGVAAALALLFFIFNIRSMWRMDREIAAYQENLKQISELEAGKKAAGQDQKTAVGEKEIETTRENAVFVNRLILLDIFPWDKVLDTFEEDMGQTVFLESLTPDENFVRIILKGYAASTEDVTRYLKSRESAGRLKKIVLVEVNVATDVAEGPPETRKPPVKFEIESDLALDRLFPVQIVRNPKQYLLPPETEDKQPEGKAVP